jgi:SAM-dependent methyltransferase
MAWDKGLIKTHWFAAHFEHAANTILNWLQIPSATQDGRSQRLLDFGCGGAITTLALALKRPQLQVIGVDIGDRFRQLPQLAEENLGLARLPDNLELRQITPGTSLQGMNLDYVTSWSVFEHLPADDIDALTRDLALALRPGGKFFLQIEPLYYSPFGSHLQRFVPEPWVHLRLPPQELEQQVLAFDGEIPPQHRGHNYRQLDLQAFKALHLREFQSLNRYTAAQIMDTVTNAGLQILRSRLGEVDDLQPPADLVAEYERSDLLTNLVVLLAQRPE